MRDVSNGHKRSKALAVPQGLQIQQSIAQQGVTLRVPYLDRRMHSKSNPGSVIGAATMKIPTFGIDKVGQKNVNQTRNNNSIISDDNKANNNSQDYQKSTQTTAQSLVRKQLSIPVTQESSLESRSSLAAVP